MVQESGDRNHLGCCNKTLVNNRMANYLHLNSWTIEIQSQPRPSKPFASRTVTPTPIRQRTRWTRWDRGIHCRCLRNLCCWDFCNLCLIKAVKRLRSSKPSEKNNRTQRNFEVQLIWKYMFKRWFKYRELLCTCEIHTESVDQKKNQPSKLCGWEVLLRKNSTWHPLNSFFPSKVFVNFWCKGAGFLWCFMSCDFLKSFDIASHCLENMDVPIYIWKPSWKQQRWVPVVKLILHSGSGMNDEWIHGMNEWKFWDGCLFSVVHGANDHKHGVGYTVCICLYNCATHWVR